VPLCPCVCATLSLCLWGCVRVGQSVPLLLLVCALTPWRGRCGTCTVGGRRSGRICCACWRVCGRALFNGTSMSTMCGEPCTIRSVATPSAVPGPPAQCTAHVCAKDKSTSNKAAETKKASGLPPPPHTVRHTPSHRHRSTRTRQPDTQRRPAPPRLSACPIGTIVPPQTHIHTRTHTPPPPIKVRRLVVVAVVAPGSASRLGLVVGRLVGVAAHEGADNVD
jgi:hypothetical protein